MSLLIIAPCHRLLEQLAQVYIVSKYSWLTYRRHFSRAAKIPRNDEEFVQEPAAVVECANTALYGNDAT